MSPALFGGPLTLGAQGKLPQLNRCAISLPRERPTLSGTPTAVLAEKQGINFMPFYSPTFKKAEFSCEELELFQHHFEEGYHLTHDGRDAGDESGKLGKSEKFSYVAHNCS